MSSPDHNQTFIAALEHETLITVKGPDASKFLQGQVTCDVRTITQSASLGAHCSHKGRMLFSFLALASNPENIYLRLLKEQNPTALAALNKYIIFSKAKAENTSSDNLLLGIWGPGARAAVTSTFGVCPSEASAFIQTEQHSIIQLAESRFECWLHSGNATDNTDTQKKLAQHAALSNHQHWQLLDIRSGIGHVYADNSEQFIPQMLNYQALGGISFNKGCYTGQEVVARMQYHGKLKRHMYRVTTDHTTETPLTGAAIYSGDSEKSVGRVVCASKNNQTLEALVVITDSSFESQRLFLDTQHQQILVPAELPYAINEE